MTVADYKAHVLRRCAVESHFDFVKLSPLHLLFWKHLNMLGGRGWNGEGEPPPDIDAAAMLAEDEVLSLDKMRDALQDRTPHREKLPDTRPATTFHIELLTPDGKLDAYATVGLYDDGRPGELFLSVRGAGAERYNGLADAFALALSIALQHGIPLKLVLDKLRGTRAQPTGRSGQRLDASLLDLLARRLEEKFCPTPPTEGA